MKTQSPVDEIPQQFPSKSYKRRKNVTNILLHKMENDAGYPQDILTKKQAQETRKAEKEKDYLKLNTKNLKNFFADRIPQKDVDIFKNNYTIDPARMFDIKRKQYQLKLETKITLDNTFDSEFSLSTIQPKKVHQTFLVRDKNMEFKKKFLEEDSLKPKRAYQSNNHRKSTNSYLKKYSNIIKKQAYTNTFGVQEALIPTPYQTSRKSALQIAQTPRPFSLNQNRRQERQNQKQAQDLKNQKKFSLAIEKLDRHRQQLDPDDRANKKPYVKREFKSNQLEKANKKEMLNWISQTTRNYQKKVINEGVENLEEIEDLKKLNKKFYKELLEHKAKRLKVREYQIGQQNVQSNRTSRVSNSLMTQTQTIMLNEYGQRTYESPKRNFERTLSISNCSLSDLNQDIQGPIIGNWGCEKKLSVIEKFQKFGHELVITLYKAKFYGITDKNNVYEAFWQNNQPYELEGSYAFFKAIKQNDISGIKKFLAINRSFIYEKDHKGRSPLIYSCLNNHTALSQFLLSQQINVDLSDKNKKTALYYAIKNQNVKIVQLLLKKASNPWSTPSCSYKNMMQKVENYRINNLMKNSRKIWTALLLITDRANKYQFWKNIKDKINAQYILEFRGDI